MVWSNFVVYRVSQLYFVAMPESAASYTPKAVNAAYLAHLAKYPLRGLILPLVVVRTVPRGNGELLERVVACSAVDVRIDICMEVKMKSAQGLKEKKIRVVRRDVRPTGLIPAEQRVSRQRVDDRLVDKSLDVCENVVVGVANFERLIELTPWERFSDMLRIGFSRFSRAIPEGDCNFPKLHSIRLLSCCQGFGGLSSAFEESGPTGLPAL